MKSIRTTVAAWTIAASVLTAGAALAADTYEIDPVHSMALFKIKHMNVGYVWGRINGPTGTIVLDKADPAKSSVTVELKAASVDTANEKRDEHLKGPDFFNAAQFPALAFKSRSVAPVPPAMEGGKKAKDDAEKEGEGGEEYLVTGDLTLLGVTKEIKAKIEKTGQADTDKGSKIGFAGGFKIKRSDFGMGKMLNMVGDEVKITVAFEAGRKPEGAAPAGTTPGTAGPTRGR